MADNNDEWEEFYNEITRRLLEGEDLDTSDIYNKTTELLTEAFNKGFGIAYDDEDGRKALQAKFKQNIEQFSYAKTLTQFNLFKDYVFNDKGQPQSFASIKKAVADTSEVFNNNYLRAETQFVTQTAIMANKWETMDSEYLEFSTVGDSLVRPAHKLFDKFTAAKNDPIWKRLYTPLDWGCRCTIVPGKASKVSKEYNSEWANKVVDPLVKNTIFDNNAALTGKIFTEKHPYFKANPTVLTMINLPDQDETKALRKAKDNEIKEWAKTNIPENGLFVKSKNFITGEVFIPRNAIKSISDHFTSPELKEVAKHIVSNIKNFTHINSAPLDPNSHNYAKKSAAGVTQFHYYEFKWNNQKFRLNTEEINGKIDKPYSVNLIIKE